MNPSQEHCRSSDEKAKSERPFEGRWGLFIDFAIRGSMELRRSLGISEGFFRQAAGQAVADPRAHFLYSVLDETQKAATHLIRLQELLCDPDEEPTVDLVSRLVHEAIVEEVGARERRLFEVLINLVLFSRTNEQPYYRHFMMLDTLEGMLRANDDLGEFQGTRSANLDSSIKNQAAWLMEEQEKIDFKRAWYLDRKAKLIQDPTVDPNRLLNSHVRLSSVRSRFCDAVSLMSASEKLCSGTTYQEAYGHPSSAVHFRPNSEPSLLWAGQDSAAVSKLGLMTMAILVRVARLANTTDTPLVRQLLDCFERSDEEHTQAVIEQITRRVVEVGDFVLAYGDLAEVLEVRESKYAYRSYKVLYLAKRPLEELREDWFPARYVSLLMPRASTIESIRGIMEKLGLTSEEIKDLEGIDGKNQRLALRKAVLDLWPQIKERIVKKTKAATDR